MLSWEECSCGVSGMLIAYKHRKGSNKDLFAFYINIAVYKALPDPVVLWVPHNLSLREQELANFLCKGSEG